MPSFIDLREDYFGYYRESKILYAIHNWFCKDNKKKIKKMVETCNTRGKDKV